MAEGSDHIDYEETPDLTEVHAAIQRENTDPHADVTPAPLWVILVCGLAICWAGAYVGMFHGGFSKDVYNEFDSSPSVLFPQPERANAKAGPAAAEDMVAIGKGVYQGNCQSCHQPNGLGQAGAIPPLAGSEWVMGTEKRLALILLKGLTGAVQVKEATYNGVMPPWEAALSDKKIAAVLTYVRQEWGNKAGPIAAAQLTAARKEFTAHKASATEAELRQIPDDAKLEGGAPAGGAGAPPKDATTAAPAPGGAPNAPAAASGEAPPADLAKLMDEGKKSYMTICVACHQPSGAGLPGAFPPLIKSEYVVGAPDRLAAMVLKGVMGPITVDGKPFNSMMPPQEAALTDQKIAAVLTFVRNSFENKASAVTPEIVNGVRKKLTGRPTPWTEAELKAWDSGSGAAAPAPGAAPTPNPTGAAPPPEAANPVPGASKPADPNPAGPAASQPKAVTPEPATPPAQ